MLLNLPGTNDPGLSSQPHKEERRGKLNNGQSSPCCPTHQLPDGSPAFVSQCGADGCTLDPLSLYDCGSGVSLLLHPVMRSLSVLNGNAIADMYSFDCFSIGRGRGGHRSRAEFVHFLGARLLAFLLIMLTSGGLRYTFIE